MSLRHWLALVRVPGLGPRLGSDLLARCGNPEAVFGSGPSVWREAGATEKSLAGLADPDWPAVDEDLRWLDNERHHFITSQDAAYPELLKEISDPPLGLFCVGDTELLKSVQLAMVGSRNPSRSGMELANDFATTLSRHGLVICSGLAMGVDAIAHEAALKSNGLTVAVCGTGLDRVYPASNKALAHAIAEEGLLLSEFPTGTPPLPSHFPRRNRIISGLSLGVLVVEAARKSGSLITARMAMEQGREVFAIPGSIHNPLARGCHRLIRQGAKLVESAEDILEELAPLLPIVDNAPAPRAESSPESAIQPLDDDYLQLLDAMGYEPVDANCLIERSGLTAESVSSMLLILELQGLVSVAPGGTYIRNGQAIS